jgi:hypothetical protein
MRRRLVLAAGLVLAVLGAPAVARADVTAFVGVNGTPSNRTTTGISVGMGLLVLGFEVEYAHAREDDLTGAPALTTGMFNVLVQTPVAVSGVQLYGTAGGGIYRETLGETHQVTQFGTNVGGGVKLKLAGPLRLRLDYRVFLLHGEPLFTKTQRFYAGLNLGL